MDLKLIPNRDFYGVIVLPCWLLIRKPTYLFTFKSIVHAEMTQLIKIRHHTCKWPTILYSDYFIQVSENTLILTLEGSMAACS